MLVVGQAFSFEQRVEFQPDDAAALLRAVPAAPGIFALRGEREDAQPYLTRAADLRRRLRRLLLPPEPATTFTSTHLSLEGDRSEHPPVLSKRLNLRARIRWVEWTRTGSEFESILLLYQATRAAFGAERARERLKLSAPFALRLTVEHEHPRLYVTNRLSRRSLAESFGPFASRNAAERYAEAVSELFKLRRCHENLVVHPDHPGCAYGEMKLCLAPCKAAVTAREYAAEAGRVEAFLRTGGASLLAEIAAQREAASEAMDFEAAAALHTRWEKVKTAANLADELIRPLPELRAVVVQQAAPLSDGESTARTDDAAVFLLQGGQLAGPERLSTLGVRAVREQTAVGSSLFAQPLMLAAVPEAPTVKTPSDLSSGAGAPRSEEMWAAAATPPRSRANLCTVAVAERVSPPPSTSQDRAGEHSGSSVAANDPAWSGGTSLPPEDRARLVLARLSEAAARAGEPEPAERADVLALFRRWYYRPEKQRAGEIFLPSSDGSWPLRRLLNGAARVVLGPPSELSPVDREAAREAVKTQKTRTLHPGREGVERVVPVLPKRANKRGKAVLPNEALL